MGQAASYEKGQAALPSCLPDPCRCEGEELAMGVLMPAKAAQASRKPLTEGNYYHVDRPPSITMFCPFR